MLSLKYDYSTVFHYLNVSIRKRGKSVDNQCWQGWQCTIKYEVSISFWFHKKDIAATHDSEEHSSTIGMTNLSAHLVRHQCESLVSNAACTSNNNSTREKHRHGEEFLQSQRGHNSRRSNVITGNKSGVHYKLDCILSPIMWQTCMSKWK